MPDQYYQSTLTGQQLDEAFSKLGQVDESAAAAAASAQAAAQSARDARQAAESLTGLPAVTEADTENFCVWPAACGPPRRCPARRRRAFEMSEYLIQDSTLAGICDAVRASAGCGRSTCWTAAA